VSVALSENVKKRGWRQVTLEPGDGVLYQDLSVHHIN
jgi:hypothetical protein